MSKKKELLAILITAILSGITSVFLAQTAIFTPNRSLEIIVLLKVFFTSFNTVVLLGISYNYLKIYNEIQTSICRSLLLFSSALLMYAVTSSPLLHVMAGFQIISVGPFTFLPDLFVTAASLVLLHESYR